MIAYIEYDCIYLQRREYVLPVSCESGKKCPDKGDEDLKTGFPK